MHFGTRASLMEQPGASNCPHSALTSPKKDDCLRRKLSAYAHARRVGPKEVGNKELSLKQHKSLEHTYYPTTYSISKKQQCLVVLVTRIFLLRIAQILTMPKQSTLD